VPRPQRLDRLPCSRHLLPSLALVASLALALACSSGGGGGGGGGGAQAADEGSVAVLLTDGPVDPAEFEHIFVTFTQIVLIGEPGQVTIFRGRETIDLRDYEDVGKLVTLGRRVPAGVYEKIRLEVDEIELVPAGGGASIFPKLPPKIDLNPRESFRVRRGRLLLVQLDMDAAMSILIVETGNGGYRFRPVVFVDILEGAVLGKLVLLRGTVEEIDRQAETFLLCDTHPVSRPLGNGRETDYDRDQNDPDDRDDFCVQVAVTDDTSFFDEAGDPALLDDLREGDDASVLGRFRRRNDEDLVFEAAVVQIGDASIALDGAALTGVGADDRFSMELDSGQGVVTEDGTLLVQLQDGTRIFSRRGTPLAPQDIEVGDRVRSVGVLSLSAVDDLLKAAYVVVDQEARDHARVDGEITSVANGGASLEVTNDDGTFCVDVPADAKVFRVTIDGNDGEAEYIDRSDLSVGDQVSVFGSADGCFEAGAVIVFVEAGASASSTTTSDGGADRSAEAEPSAGHAAEGGGAALQQSSGGVEVFVAGPRRVHAGLVWAQLPSEDDEEAPAPGEAD
jgi:hypothetical protein